MKKENEVQADELFFLKITQVVGRIRICIWISLTLSLGLPSPPCFLKEGFAA